MCASFATVDALHDGCCPGCMHMYHECFAAYKLCRGKLLALGSFQEGFVKPSQSMEEGRATQLTLE